MTNEKKMAYNLLVFILEEVQIWGKLFEPYVRVASRLAYIVMVALKNRIQNGMCKPFAARD